MEFNINDLHVNGNPDGFFIYSGNTYVGNCMARSLNSLPFAIWDGNIYISKVKGGSHRGFIEDYDNLRKRDDWSSGRFWKAIDRSKYHNEYGGGYLNKNVPFPYYIMCFWWGKDGDLHLDKKIVDKLVKKLSKGNVNNVLVVSFNDDDYGKVYSYNNWIGKVSKADEKQKEIYNLHLMGADTKHDATSDFRTNRDRKIGQKLTNDKGVEMPVAQYMAMVHSENIKRIVKNVLKEYIDKDSKKLISETWTNNNTELKNHLKNIAHMDDKTLKTLANVFPTYYLNYLIHVNPGIEDEDYYYDLVDVADNHSGYSMSYYIEKLNLPIDKRFGYYVKNTINKFPRRYYDDSRINYRYTEIPDNVTLNYKKPFINKVLVHKCSNDGDAENILLNGFKYGQDLGNLAWSCGVKNNGNYGFAYEFNDYAENCNNYPNYGAEGVVFIGSGVMVTHHGDRRNKYDKSPNECIFDINSVSSFVCRFRVSHGYCEIYNANNKLVLKKENYTIPKALEWISNNLIRY